MQNRFLQFQWIRFNGRLLESKRISLASTCQSRSQVFLTHFPDRARITLGNFSLALGLFLRDCRRLSTLSRWIQAMVERTTNRNRDGGRPFGHDKFIVVFEVHNKSVSVRSGREEEDEESGVWTRSFAYFKSPCLSRSPSWSHMSHFKKPRLIHPLLS